jgi:hypothetical protein
MNIVVMNMKIMVVMVYVKDGKNRFYIKIEFTKFILI